MPVKDAIIIGAGLSGLTCAQTLHACGKTIRVLEKCPHPGGVIRSKRIDGYLCEAGPNSLLIKSPKVADYLRNVLNLGPEMVPANQLATKRFLVRNGRILALPSSLRSAVTTSLFSWPAKFRFLGEPWQKRTRASDTSVAEFVSRRLGPEFLDYGIAPLVSGIFAGDARKLSMRHAFPKVWNLEAKAGSLIRGSIALRRERKELGEKPFKSQLVSFRDGLATLTDHQASRIGSLLHTGVDLQSIEYLPLQDLWQLTWRSPDSGENTEQARKLIVTTPSHAWGQLPFDPCLCKTLQELPTLEYPPVATLVLGFARDQVSHLLDGFGVLIPPKEHAPILGAIFSSTLFPHRAPEGCVSLMVFLGGSTNPEAGRWEAQQAVSQSMQTLGKLLDIRGDPVFSAHFRWEKAIPQYHLGHEAFLEGLAHVEEIFPGLHFLGNFRGGPGLSDVMDSALTLGAILGHGQVAPDSFRRERSL